MIQKLLSWEFWRDSVKLGLVSGYDILKLTLPAVIIVEILEILGATEYLAILFAPLMEFIGLPGWTSIVWTTAMLSNLYGGLVVLAGSSGFTELTTAQMSVLGTAMLIAHSLPVEARITQAVGVKFWHMIGLRLAGAYTLCFILHLTYSSTGLLNEPLTLSWELPSKNLADAGYLAAFGADLLAVVSLSMLVIVLVILMEVLKVVRVVHYCELLLEPLLKTIGISSSLSHIMAVGGLLGLTYGSGVLLAESRRQKFAKRDLAVAMLFISMCHAIIEDSIILVLSGAHISAVLFARIVFCILLAGILMRWRPAMAYKFYS